MYAGVECPRIFSCRFRISYDILHAGVECPWIFCMRVYNVLGYLVCGCRMSKDILHAGVEYSSIFCMFRIFCVRV